MNHLFYRRFDHSNNEVEVKLSKDLFDLQNGTHTIYANILIGVYKHWVNTYRHVEVKVTESLLEM